MAATATPAQLIQRPGFNFYETDDAPALAQLPGGDIICAFEGQYDPDIWYVRGHWDVPTSTMVWTDSGQTNQQIWSNKGVGVGWCPPPNPRTALVFRGLDTNVYISYWVGNAFASPQDIDLPPQGNPTHPVTDESPSVCFDDSNFGATRLVAWKPIDSRAINACRITGSPTSDDGQPDNPPTGGYDHMTLSGPSLDFGVKALPPPAGPASVFRMLFRGTDGKIYSSDASVSAPNTWQTSILTGADRTTTNSPAIAFNRHTGRFAMAWADSRTSAPGSSVSGICVGGAKPDGTWEPTFAALGNTTTNAWSPSGPAICQVNGHDFLVVWRGWDNRLYWSKVTL